MIVITAPTGQIGHHTVEHLLAVGALLRLIVRDPAKLGPDLRDRVEIVEGSHGDPAVVNRAFEGADAVFWLVPPGFKGTMEETYLDFTRPAAEAIRHFEVKRVVDVTALGRGTRWENDAGLVTASLKMDDMLMATGAAFRGLAMPSFMDNMLRNVGTIRDTGMIFGPLDPDKRAPLTATRDMGAVAARLLADESWTGQAEVPVLGPEDLSSNDMAAIVSEVLGREVRYQQVPFDAFEAHLRERGISEDFISGYLAMFRAKDEGMDNVAKRTPEFTGPTSFRQWCEEVLKPAMAG